MKMIDYELAMRECKRPSIYDLGDVPEFLSYLPTVDAVPIEYCEMLGEFYGDDCKHCTKCRESFNEHYNELNRFKFCPNCGAKVKRIE